MSKVEQGSYAGLTAGEVVDRYREKKALIAACRDNLAIVGFPEKIDELRARISRMEAGAGALKATIPTAEFDKANRPHRRLVRYLGEVAGTAIQEIRLY